eukprot:m.130629 g.130629  ORF g.130629 m.130629 type:complete len:557 (-) comp29490_c0_seq2:114-1784(-)
MAQPPTELNIICCSANIGNEMPTSLEAWIPKDGLHNGVQMDVIAVGAQEAVYKIHKPDKLDNTGNNNDEAEEVVKNNKKRAGAKDVIKEMFTGDCIAHLEKEILACIGGSYKLIKKRTSLEMRIFVFVHIDHAHAVGDVEAGKENTGLFKIVGNKGGQAIKFRIHGTEMCFMNAHLAAHFGDKHLARRNESVVEILKGIDVGNYDIDIDAQFPYTFFMGDLNYRTDIRSIPKYKTDLETDWAAKEPAWLKLWETSDGLLSEDVLAVWEDKGTLFRAEWETVRGLIAELDKSPKQRETALQTLRAADQLTTAMKNNEVFVGWNACVPQFKPTFKVLRPPDARVSADHPLEFLEKRIPSYCDRVLWKTLPGAKDLVSQTSFEACNDFLTSDHKPVRASFKIDIDNGRAHGDTPKTKDQLHFKFINLQAKLIKPEKPAKDIPDAYVELDSWPEDLLIGKQTKTRTMWNTYRPIWKNETILTRVAEQAINACSTPHIIICVRDKNHVTTRSSIGFCSINIKALQSHVNSSDTAYKFELPITEHSLQVGTMMGEVEVTRKK